MQEKLKNSNAAIASERQSLDPEKLASDFKAVYRDMQDGAPYDQFALTFAAGVIATRELRVEVLEKMAGELRAEFEELRKRNKQLCKVLGQKQEI